MKVGIAGAGLQSGLTIEWLPDILGKQKIVLWARDRAKDRLPLEQAVHLLTGRNAAYLGLQDRGRIAVGQRADLNLIDPARLAVGTPHLVRDMPAGGKRFLQRATGYRATLVHGEVIAADGVVTGARPGRVARSA